MSAPRVAPAGGPPCPKCGAQDSATLDSRAVPTTGDVRRRRECACGLRFTTYESTRVPVSSIGHRIETVLLHLARATSAGELLRKDFDEIQKGEL